MRKVLFIHRSVGQNLIRDGHIYNLVDKASPGFEFADYNHNTDTLTTTKGESKPGLRFPGDDTKPKDYAALFSADGAKSYKPVHDMVAGYDVVAIKSCYPNANITSDAELQRVMDNYQSIARFFRGSPKQLVIVTTPPLRRLRTTPEAAARARKLAIWLTTTKLGGNVSVFDFFDLLADPQVDTLKKEYRRALFLDQHPNAKASQEVAPRFEEFLAGMIRPMKNTLNNLQLELHVPDFAPAKIYYGKLGFKILWTRLKGDIGDYLVMEREGTVLSFWPGNKAVEEQPYFKRFPRHTKRGYGVEIVLPVENIRDYYNEIKDQANMVEPLVKQPWGLYDFRVEDPFGYYLRFTEPHDIRDPENAVD